MVFQIDLICMPQLVSSEPQCSAPNGGSANVLPHLLLPLRLLVDVARGRPRTGSERLGHVTPVAGLPEYGGDL